MKSKVLMLITGLALLGVAVISSARAQENLEIYSEQYDEQSYQCLGQVCLADRVQIVGGYFNGERGTVVALDYYRNNVMVSLDYRNQNVEVPVNTLYVISHQNPYPQPYPQPQPNPYPPQPYPQPQPRPVVCPPGYYYDTYRRVCVRPNPRPQPRPVPRPVPPRPRPQPPRPYPQPAPMPRPPQPAPRPNPGVQCPPGTHYNPAIGRCVR